MSAGYIYLLLAEGTQPKRYKIGLTNNPERKKRTSQPSIPLKYRILAALFLAAFLWGFIRGMTMQLPTKPLQPNLTGEKHNGR